MSFGLQRKNKKKNLTALKTTISFLMGVSTVSFLLLITLINDNYNVCFVLIRNNELVRIE